MFVKRTLENVINNTSKHFKVVLVSGARQVGKSTLLKICDKNRNYVTLDNPNIREMALKEPELFLDRYSPPVIIDEIQYAPNLLPYIKIRVDNSSDKGGYWLTGSQQFNMMKNVSESLAGRAGIVNLMGFSLSELEHRTTQMPFLPVKSFIEDARTDVRSYSLKELYKIIWRGAYPEVNVDKDVNWEIFYSSYLQTYLERDIRNLTVVSNEMTFLTFIKAVAARTGQLINYSDIANEVGISVPTVKSWLSVLISSGVVYFLPPYFNNINKRLVKTPKVYFADTGLCSYLTGWNSPDVLESGAMSGAMFETFVVTEIIKSYKHNGKTPNIYYYRDRDKKEIDVIIEQNGKLYPVEIKKTANPDKNMIRNFDVIPEDRRGSGAVVCLVKEDLPLTSNVNAIPVGYLSF